MSLIDKAKEVDKSKISADKLSGYLISADGGRTWSYQWLNENDLLWHIDHGFIVRDV